jgi:hypothetical protein
MRQNRGTMLALAFIATFSPVAVDACEPIIPLTHLMSGSNAVGPMLIMKSAIWLAVAVVLKSTAFILFERRLPWRTAFLFMLIANILSTIPGLLTSLFSGSIAFLALPIIFVMGLLAQRRLTALKLERGDPNPKLQWVSFAFTVTYFASLIMFYMASEFADPRHATQYWFLKFTFTTSAVLLGLAISAVLEEYAIARLAAKTVGRSSFYTSVIRANYVTLGLVLLVAAIQTLPRRLHSPGFLISCWHSVSSFFLLRIS